MKGCEFMRFFLKVTDPAFLLILILVAALVSLIGFAFAPAIIPFHFNGYLRPDGFINKWAGFSILPVVMWLIWLLSRKGVSYKASLCILFLFIIHVLLVLYALFSK
ncbi:hypothetical protein HMPREF3213_00922 [Heyndrickxia coagulans]|uniref:DUF1648 domain-containing protein n=3 Tax=Heyndrickxia TaxID=2837504 RepID=A0A133KX09_HEYCO|nr:hypothetical protein HMPREF3213_00922 [Heyndrickxia coagulans]